MTKPERQSCERKDSSALSSSSSPKYKGVRKRKWGKYVCEIRLPNSRERIWLGSYDTAKKAARAFDAALFCLRGKAAKFNFPDSPPEIVNGRSMSPAEIQVAAARFANSEPEPHNTDPSDNSDPSSSLSSSSELLLHVDSPCPSVSDHQMTENTFEDGLVDLFSSMGTTNNVSDFGIFPGFDDLSGELFLPPLPNIDYLELENYTYDGLSSQEGSFLWNF